MSTLDQIEDSPRKSWLTGKRLIIIALSALILLRIAIDFIPIRVHISPESTFIDGPIREDGTPDYAAYLNKHWSDGVTPENNAVVDLMQAFGPGIIDEKTREAYFEQLGIPMPPLEGDYHVDFLDFMTQSGSDWNSIPGESERLIEQMTDAQTRPWTQEEFPEIAEWLQANEQPLQAILAATNKTHYFSPMIPPHNHALIHTLLPTAQQSRAAARLIMTRAMLELQQGNVDRALELTLACHRLSRLVSHHPTLIGSLVAYANAVIASVGDEQIILSGQLTSAQANEYREQLKKLPDFQPIQEVIDHGERLISLDLIVAMSNGRIETENYGEDLALRWGFNPNPALLRFNEMYDEFNVAMQQPDPLQRSRQLEAVYQQLEVKAQPDKLKVLLGILIHTRYAIGEAAGGILVQLTAPAVTQAVTAEERARVRQQLIDLGYALAAQHAETGTFPQSLEDLVPQHINALPHDPFSGASYRYQLTESGFLLYSIGPNTLDDGGLTTHGADDIAFGDRQSE